MRRPTDLLAALTLLIATSLSACSLGGADDDAENDTPAPRPSPTATPVEGAVPPEFFGMHDSDPVGDSWPDAPVGSLRVWDSGAVWSQIETSPGTYDFTRLDAIVESARRHDAQALIVLGQTPSFHASKPDVVGSYGPGASSMPDLAAWTAYVTAVVERYAGEGDVAFQVWNEANVEGYWTGTPRQMAKLTAAARAVVDAQPSPPLLVAPAMATRLLFHRVFFREFYRQRVGGVPVADLVDVLSFQLYPAADKAPEAASELLAATRTLLEQEGVALDKPVWNTEINYGLQGGEPAQPLPPDQQAAYVARTYLLNAATTVDRVYWYSWDLHTIANTDMVAADNSTLSAAGQAYRTVHRWLVGSRVDSCGVLDDGLRACALQTPQGPAQAYWRPDGETEVRTSFQATSAETLGAAAAALPLGGTVLRVGPAPVLVTSDPSGVPALPPRL